MSRSTCRCSRPEGRTRCSSARRTQASRSRSASSCPRRPTPGRCRFPGSRLRRRSRPGARTPRWAWPCAASGCPARRRRPTSSSRPTARRARRRPARPRLRAPPRRHDSLPATDPARGLAGVLGLVDGDGVPELPVADVIAQGPTALAAWLAQCLTGAAREPWLGHLATLLGAVVAGSGDAATVRVPVGGGVTVVLDVATVPGTAGLPVVTPRLSVEVAGTAGSTLALTVEPVSIDLATGAAVALPSLTALVRVGSGGPGALLGPVPGPGGLQITVGSFEGGFALDADRRPLLILAALGAQRRVDAVRPARPHRRGRPGRRRRTGGGRRRRDPARRPRELGDAVGVLLGLTDPPSGPAPQVDPVALLADPLGALRARWLALLAAPGRDRPVGSGGLAGDDGRGRGSRPRGDRRRHARQPLPSRRDRRRRPARHAFRRGAAGSVVSVVLAAARPSPSPSARRRGPTCASVLRADLAPAAPSAELGTGCRVLVVAGR